MAMTGYMRLELMEPGVQYMLTEDGQVNGRLVGRVEPMRLLTLGLSVSAVGSLVLLAGYPLMVHRAYRYAHNSGRTANEALLFGLFCTLAKFPQAQGLLRFYWGKLFKKPSRLIEYNPASGKSRTKYRSNIVIS
ncbi:hypothetical protein HC762_02055 [bacterium]|nr:hypothetical protein [bacterium]